MKSDSKNSNDEKEIFNSVKKLTETEPHILRNIIIGLGITFLLGLVLFMIIATIFAEACATKIVR